SPATSAPKLVAPKPRAPLKKKIAGVVGADADEGADLEFEVMCRAASPPLLGQGIVFPRCQSPETTKISTDLPFTLRETEENRRDLTQKSGLWRGYCFQTACKDDTPHSLPSSACRGSLWSLAK